jgi:O-antigen/teichoic acid export membrane protein
VVCPQIVSDPPKLATQVNRGVAWAGASQAIIALADLASQVVVLALWISANEYGIAMLAFQLYTLLDTAADLGVTSSLIQRDDHTPDRVATVFWFNVFISSGLFVLLLVLGPLYGRLQGHDVVGWLLIAYGGKLVFQNSYAIPFALLRKQLRFGEIAKIRTVAHLGESAARVVFAAAGVTIWCFTLAALTRVLLFGVLMQARHPFVPRFVFRPREVAEYIRFGLRAAASQIIYRVYVSIDSAVVGYYFGATANGIYNLALWIVLEPVRTITNVVSDVAFPAFARMRHDRERLVGQFITFTRLNLVAVLPFLVLVVLVIPEFLLAFYRDQWSEAQLIITVDAARILCLTGALRALAFLGPQLLDAIGRPDLTLRYQSFAAIIVPGGFVTCAWTLGDQLGPVSVAVGWSVAYPVAFAVLAYLVAFTIGLPVGRYLRECWGIAACCVAGLVAGVATWPFTRQLGHGMRLVVEAGLASLVMGALLAYWQDIRPRAVVRSLK